MIHILHLCSYYTGSTVYRDLINELAHDQRVGKQFVYSPIRSANLDRKYSTSARNVSIYYAHCQNLMTRASLLFKQLKFWHAFFSSPEAREGLNKATVIHAHTLYADGVMAYLMFRLYDKPYVVTVRGTDVNLGDRYFLLWRPLAKAVLRNAKHVFFVSPSHLTLTARRYSGQLAKTSVLSNGLNHYWLDNAVSRKQEAKQTGTLTGVFIGAINRNKNLKAALQAFHQAANGRPYRFLVIGGNYRDFEQTFGKLEKAIQTHISFQGFINDRSIIRKALASADVFVMPSFSETFGLTYLEAISQGTPVVYSKGQGVDGYFEDGEIGYACNPQDINSITEAIRNTICRFPQGLQYPSVQDNPAQLFSWPKVAGQLINKGYQGISAK